ncbi:hypothetical protein DEJ30_08140 [Curtobacterium sp. MCPF17_003]|uniref:antitoxin VbhA family protein n=1 Tax=Curtobacterium sp. MCPF17_003 TaxID=2175637 RepID=UPI000D863934|nr:antitoxin VbhA family protein [Curtobacterium sp. MCPF17_003]PYY64425.1 hypothetical protein DEJ30_08140 [Curtobacterium sp. MCPF17_003]
MTVNQPRPAGRSGTPLPVSDAEVQCRMDFADAALGAAGHEVTDQDTRALARLVAAGEISADEAIARRNALRRGHRTK